jgi:hypothetical protein
MRHVPYLASVVVATLIAAPAHAQETPTFHKDVEPILQKNCQACHRPNQIAPMSLLTYKQVRPWSRAIKNAVVTKVMPPWFADTAHSVPLRNDRTLAKADIETIVRWVDGGSPEGDPRDAPPPPTFAEAGWIIPPDVVIDLPQFPVPANGVLEWTNVTIPSPFKEDTLITSMELLPDHPGLIHHIGMGFHEHKPDTIYNKPVYQVIPRDESGSAFPRSRPGGPNAPPPDGGTLFTIDASYVPGVSSWDYRQFAAAKLVKANSDITFSMHYTPNGKEVVDRSKLGVTLAKAPANKRYVTLAISSPSDAESFAIPPGAANWESPTAEATFLVDAELVWMQPHMHIRGKDMTYTLEYPDGRKQTILSVPNYNFNWQLGYDVKEPIKIPKGTKIVVYAHFDNSARNKFNPDPTRTVYYGNQTWEEMMQPWFAVLVDKKVDPGQVLGRRNAPTPQGAE